MNQYLLDSGFLYALVDNNDVHNVSVTSSMKNVHGHILFPEPAITETAYFIKKNLGAVKLSQFFAELNSVNYFSLTAPQKNDYLRVSEILIKYADVDIDFVDALIFAMAERLNIRKILTVDNRHFRIFRPRHCDAFELFPETL